MRIAITNPTNWPYLRRGAERFINELAAFLAKRGHDVTIVTGKPGRSETVSAEGYTTIYCRRLWHPSFARFGFLEFHAFFLPALVRLLSRRYDVVMACTFMDGYAAKLARRLTGTPYVHPCLAIPPRVQTFRSLSLKGAISDRTMLGADATVSISEYVRDYVKTRWNLESDVLPVPVDTERIGKIRRARARSTILCPVALSDPRKGGRVLMRAFDRLKRRRPDAVLRFAWSTPPAERAELFALAPALDRSSVEFLDSDVDIFEQYASATCCVLPSLWEAQGMVLLESLAAVTPGVATRSGALPEIVSDARVGRLFEPGSDNSFEPTDEASLVEALDECLDLGARSDTADHCRRHAERYSWERLGPRWEELLQRASKRVSVAAAAECLQ